MTGADASGTNRATVQRTSSATTIAARAIHARRTMRRSHSRRRWGRSALRTASSVRVQRSVQLRHADPAARLVGCARAARPLRQASARRRGIRTRLSTGRAPRRSRQRRVGETNWTERMRKTTDRTSQATTVLGQIVSAVRPERHDVVDDDRTLARDDDHAAREPAALTYGDRRSGDGRRDHAAAAGVDAVGEDDAVLVEHERVPEPAVVPERVLRGAQGIGRGDLGLGEERVQIGQGTRGWCPDSWRPSESRGRRRQGLPEHDHEQRPDR